ncbi:DNA cytosine methyltransferase, partial [Staphylococcus equorum]
EWRVINAADYGNAQRRRRVFIFGYKQGLDYSNEMDKESLEDIIYKNGMFAKAFPIEDEPNKKRVAQTIISNDIAEVSDNFK